MYKTLYALSVLLIAHCGSSNTKEQTQVHDTAIVNHEAKIVEVYPTLADSHEDVPAAIEVGDSTLIIGNFDGDNIPDSGYLVVVDKYIAKFDPRDDEHGEENHQDSVIYDYIFRFRDEKQRTLSGLGGAAVALVNEGDLNHDGTDKISVLQQYLVTGMCIFSTYTYHNDKWEEIFSSEFHGHSAPIDKIEIDGRIVMEDSIPYYYENDEVDRRKLEFVSR